jgi:hypothetical protein
LQLGLYQLTNSARHALARNCQHPLDLQPEAFGAAHCRQKHGIPAAANAFALGASEQGKVISHRAYRGGLRKCD